MYRQCQTFLLPHKLSPYRGQFRSFHEKWFRHFQKTCGIDDARIQKCDKSSGKPFSSLPVVSDDVHVHVKVHAFSNKFSPAFIDSLRIANYNHRKIHLKCQSASSSFYSKLFQCASFSLKHVHFSTNHVDIRKESPSPGKEKVPRTLDQTIYHMQADIRRKRRVHKAEIHNAIELIEKAGDASDFSVFLLNCCCDILPDLTPDYRVKLADRIWSVIQKSKKYTTPDFEAMLKAVAVNEDQVKDPMQFIKEAKSANVEVTPTMYFFALLTVCQRGDTEAMVQILSSMKENGVSVNEKFFNALILGNGRSGDLESAKEIVELMYSSQIMPSSKTWTKLLQVYIEAGDLVNLKKTFTGVDANQFSEEEFYELLKAAGRQANSAILDQIIDWALTYRKMHYLSIKRLTVILVHQGYCENALKIVLKFSKTLKSEKEEFLGAFFIKELHWIVRDPETYLNLVISLQDDNRNPYALNMAAESCLKHGKIDLACRIYEGMFVMNIPIRPHYFYPVLLSKTERKDIVGAVKVMQEMKALNVKPDWEMLVGWIVPILYEKTQDMLETLKIVHDSCDVSYASGLLSAGLVVAFQHGKIHDAFSLTQHLKSKVAHPEVVVQSLLKCIIPQRCEDKSYSDLSYVPKILKFVADNVQSDDNRDFVGLVILKLVESNEIEEAEMILEALRKLDIPLSASVVDSIKDKVCIDDFKVNPALERFNGNGRRVLSPKEMDETALECHRQELEAKDLNVRGTYRKLFLKHCQQGDLAKALEVKENFEENYGSLSSGMKSALMGTYIQNEVLEPALELYQSLTKTGETEADSENVEIDTYKIIDLATLMAKKGFLKEALQLIKSDCPKRSNHRSETFSRNVVRFLETVSHANVEALQKAEGNAVEESVVYDLTEYLLQLGMMQPINPTLAPVIKDLIRRDKLSEAVEKFELFSQKFRAAPAVQELTYCVLDNPELLRRVFKCSAAVKGIREGKRLLALAKSDVGDIDGAAAIFLELDDQLSFISILRQCEYLATKKQFSKILNLINSLHKTGRGYNCSGLYEIAIKACERTGDMESLQLVLSSMQEHDLHIPQKVKKMLGKNKNVSSSVPR